MIINIEENPHLEWLVSMATDPAQFVVTPQLELLNASLNGDTLLRQERGIRLVDGKIEPLKQGLAAPISELIRGASHKGFRTLLRCGDDDDAIVWTAASRMLLGSNGAPQSILMAFRPLIKTEPMTHADCASLFGLTQAESRLAVELCAGYPLAQISAKRGVHISTLRAQLRSIFAKTGVSKQSEFVSAVWRAAAV